MDYALVENGIVTNLIWLHPSNADDFPNAVQIGDIPVAIGDTYDGEHFFRNGERVLTHEERLMQDIADMQAALELLGVTADE